MRGWGLDEGYLDADFGLVVGAECLDEVLGLGEDALGDVGVDGVGLEHLVEVLLDAGAPGEHLVGEAGDLEALAVLAQPHHRHVGEALLPHRLHQRPRHLRRRRRRRGGFLLRWCVSFLSVWPGLVCFSWMLARKIGEGGWRVL